MSKHITYIRIPYTDNIHSDYRTPTRNSSFQMAQGCQHRHQSVILVSRSMRSSRWMHRSCHAADLVTIICVESDRCVISSVRPHCVPSWWHSYSAGSTTVTVSTRGCSKTVLQRLQRVQDAAARLVHGASRLETAMPLIRELHWLPVPSRIQYKLSMLMYDVFHGVAPGYLVNLCRPCGDARLRSTSRGQYVVPFSRLSFGQRSFRTTGPRAWNSLPDHVRTAPSRTIFASRLKTHLYTLAYLP